MNLENVKINPWDERRDLLIPGDENATLEVCLRHFIRSANQAIEENGRFSVALSGGSTPKKIYQRLAESPYREQVDWTKVWLFWGDERSVPPESEESNYKMAMDAGFSSLPIPKEQIFRMVAEENIEENALKYEEAVKKVAPLDLVLLGMGEDGHTASLFPQTQGLKAEDRLVVANYVPQKDTWRMTLTFDAINNAEAAAIYIMGASKKHTLAEIFKAETDVERYPIQHIGTKDNPALWIIDDAAASELIQ